MPQVLIVEDDRATCEILTRLLARINCTAHCVGSAGEALLYLEEHVAPPVVLLDLGLPDAKGGLVLRRIRRDHLPCKVAVLTGADVPSDVQRLGPDAIFTKPINIADVAIWVQAACA